MTNLNTVKPERLSAGINRASLEALERKQYLVSRYAGLLQDALLYVAKDHSQLDTLLSRLPEEYRQRPQMTFDEWCDRAEANQGTKLDKRVLITHHAFIKLPCEDVETVFDGLPDMMLFFPSSVIVEVEGHFTELRDHTGCRWGDFNKRIPSYQILNPQLKEEKSC